MLIKNTYSDRARLPTPTLSARRLSAYEYVI